MTPKPTNSAKFAAGIFLVVVFVIFLLPLFIALGKFTWGLALN